jgi:hypothetical protein
VESYYRNKKYYYEQSEYNSFLIIILQMSFLNDYYLYRLNRNGITISKLIYVERVFFLEN